MTNPKNWTPKPRPNTCTYNKHNNCNYAYKILNLNALILFVCAVVANNMSRNTNYKLYIKINAKQHNKTVLTTSNGTVTYWILWIVWCMQQNMRAQLNVVSVCAYIEAKFGHLEWMPKTSSKQMKSAFNYESEKFLSQSNTVYFALKKNVSVFLSLIFITILSVYLLLKIKISALHLGKTKTRPE